MSEEATIEYEGQSMKALEGETVLGTLLRQGVNVAHSCGKGSCHSCILELKRGEIIPLHPSDPTISQSGHFLPCVSRAAGPLLIGPPDFSALGKKAEVVGRRLLAEDILELDIAPHQTVQFEAGQHLHVLRPGDKTHRSYSITTLPDEDYFFRIHVRRIPGGEFSSYLFDSALEGTMLEVRGAFGTCRYEARMQGRPMLLLGTGTGGGALHAIVRAALMAGHDAPITLYHGGRRRQDLYLDAKLRELEKQHANFRYVRCLTKDHEAEDVHHARITQVAFAEHRDLRDYELFLCGLPAMIDEARHRAVLAGANRGSIAVDSFDFNHPRKPDDAEKIQRFEADPELWAALEEGPRLSMILADFYERLFADARLSPFFHGLTPKQVAEKQYAFLADLFSGRRAYFGMNPYNAHHWMVISDELFDYREKLFEQVLVDQGLEPHLIRRFLALHEIFRKEIVKSTPRPMITKDGEIPLQIQSIETLDIDTLCDQCQREIPAGTPARYQFRLGTLHCAECAGLNAAPPP